MSSEQALKTGLSSQTVSHSGQKTTTAEQLRRAIFTGAIGSALEYYDFAMYGLASALVFNRVFFPSLGTTAGLLASFATFGAGFLARPLGGLFFGSLGDRKGRKFVLLATVALMGFATTLIGALPTGAIGAVLLVVLRLLQGFGAGAEQTGAATLMAEMAPVKQRGFYAALPFIGIFAGLTLATFTFHVLQSTLSESEMLAWGWRLPFLGSIVLIGMAVWIRLRLKESPVFEQLEANHEVIHAPMRLMLKTGRRPLIATALMRLAETGGSTIYTAVAIAYLSGFVTAQQHLPRAMLGEVGTRAVLIASLLSIFTTPLFGALTDRVGRLLVYKLGALFSVLWAIPAWWMISTGQPLWVTIALVGGFAIGANSMLGSQCAHFAELFGNRYRYSGVALSREIGALLAGGLAPLLGLYLVGLSGGQFWVMGVYMATLAVLTLIGTMLSTETRGRDLTALGDAVGKGR
ncbi:MULTISPECIES: MFS transporter [Paraburkholderia]|uniref:MFS transporter n=1 Tax=Paraburkholderia TaxID=1822464 RepID=UPI000361E0F5|nr:MULTISPECIES: MFS transporter [Paraburkholderia]MDH6147209.1 MHS family metabolite:H+ symporter-like MFS transporter [Paraburkholderia sp. WSM4179]